MWHQFVISILLDWGAAVPIGPMNLEVIRRNLRFGTPSGIAMGLGACSADVTYLLLSFGALVILTHPLLLEIVSTIGALILFWFAYNALRLKTDMVTELQNKNSGTYSYWRHWVEGYFQKRQCTG